MLYRTHINPNKDPRFLVPIHYVKSDPKTVKPEIPEPPRSEWPAYLDTLDEQLPWEPGDESHFTNLLPQDTSSPASYYRYDVWHTVNMGVGKTFVSSALVLLLHLFDGNNIVDRFQSMSVEYERFCQNSAAWLRVQIFGL